MDYLLLYGIVGVVLVIFQKWLTTKHPTFDDRMQQSFDHATRGVESALHPNGVPVRVLTAKLVGESMALFVGLAVWPILAVKLLLRFKDNKNLAIEVPHESHQGCCGDRTSLQEIEHCELVHDVSGGVPPLAFGHLNTVWLNFQAQIRPGDELCLYLHPYQGQTYDDWRYGAEGYVIRRDGKVVGKMLSNAG